MSRNVILQVLFGLMTSNLSSFYLFTFLLYSLIYHVIYQFIRAMSQISFTNTCQSYCWTMTLQCDCDLCPHGLKINRGHLLAIGNVPSKFHKPRIIISRTESEKGLSASLFTYLHQSQTSLTLTPRHVLQLFLDKDLTQCHCYLCPNCLKINRRHLLVMTNVPNMIINHLGKLLITGHTDIPLQQDPHYFLSLRIKMCNTIQSMVLLKYYKITLLQHCTMKKTPQNILPAFRQ